VTLAESLTENGRFLRDNFVNEGQLRALRECVHLRRGRAEFKPARVGRVGGSQRFEHIRGDQTCWLQEPLYPVERQVLDALEAVRLELNRELQLGLFDFELHYAWYPIGGAYTRHIDQPRGSDSRRISLVLYLNEIWEDADGGQLRLHGEAQQTVDIAPLGGRLIGFLSETQLHEVLPCHRERLSLAGWLRVRASP
jgi:SM-20-related protein